MQETTHASTCQAAALSIELKCIRSLDVDCGLAWHGLLAQIEVESGILHDRSA